MRVASRCPSSSSSVWNTGVLDQPPRSTCAARLGLTRQLADHCTEAGRSVDHGKVPRPGGHFRAQRRPPVSRPADCAESLLRGSTPPGDADKPSPAEHAQGISGPPYAIPARTASIQPRIKATSSSTLALSRGFQPYRCARARSFSTYFWYSSGDGRRAPFRTISAIRR